jgi:hypothetical protein
MMSIFASDPSGSRTEVFTFETLPAGLAQLQALPEAALTSPFATAALSLAALACYGRTPEAALEMLDFLKGPEPLSPFEKQFIRDRLKDKDYKILSYFDGAVPENGYTPAAPYRIRVSANPYSFPEENWATLFVTSGGADSPRQIRLRRKPSTNQWFLVELQCLSDIRVPAAADPWA